MNTEFYAFGEMLWDCLPSGRHAGGAPFNVASHLAQLGVSAFLISSVGQDTFGSELLQATKDKNINTRFVTQARAGLPTGTVMVTLDTDANATYEIVQPVAWDEISVPEEAVEAVAHARALIFGSLAGRSPHNRAQLYKLLDVPGPMKFFDINLRPPFIDPMFVIDLAGRADVVKLNDDELGRLASWVKTGEMTLNTPRSLEALDAACRIFAGASNISRICVTRAADGAAFWGHGTLVSAPAPPVAVKDTVGAGDAFMAGLVVGLTRGANPHQVLRTACRLGAYVASQNGATPLLPPDIIQEINHLA